VHGRVFTGKPIPKRNTHQVFGLKYLVMIVWFYALKFVFQHNNWMNDLCLVFYWNFMWI
jgi:hypothetical protein